MTENYPRTRLRFLAEFNPPVPPSVRSVGDIERRVLPMDAIHEFAPPSQGDTRPASSLLSGYSYLEPTDIAYAKVTPCFENGKGIVGSDLDGPTFATTEVTVLRPTRGTNQRFLAYLLQSTNFRSPAIASMTGAGGLKRVSESLMKDLMVPSPSSDEQRQIADYLDHETAEIDVFVHELQRMLDLFEERQDSLWSTAFEELRKDNPVVKVRYLVDSLVDGPFGSSLTSAHYSDSGSPVVRLGNIRRMRFSLAPRVFIPFDYARQLSAHKVVPGDVVIAGLGDDNHLLGRAAVVPKEFGSGIVKADCYRARTNNRVLPEYFAWALSSKETSETFREASRGSTRARLNLGIVSQTAIPLPDLLTQAGLIDNFAAETRQSEDASANINRAIELARERRAALITAAVTGQIDVTAKNKPAAEQLEDDIAQGLHKES